MASEKVDKQGLVMIRQRALEIAVDYARVQPQLANKSAVQTRPWTKDEIVDMAHAFERYMTGETRTT